MEAPNRMPALYLGHGAPPLLDDERWCSELAAWSADLPRPRGILIVSAHWESAPIALSATSANTPLVYDFAGFDPKYFQMQYQTPDATDLAQLLTSLFPDTTTVHQHASRGLDHGAWVPLAVMYPDADIPVLQMSIPTFDPQALLDLGRRLSPLRDHGILIIGSGFLTHGLPYLRDWSPTAQPPGWSTDFDLWATEALARGDVDTLAAYQSTAPGMPYAHPTVEHFVPLFITLGAASDSAAPVPSVIDGYFMGLAKRSLQVA
jgi:4,5-DOPA dioxygenase extradiol